MGSELPGSRVIAGYRARRRSSGWHPPGWMGSELPGRRAITGGGQEGERDGVPAAAAADRGCGAAAPAARGGVRRLPAHLPGGRPAEQQGGPRAAAPGRGARRPGGSPRPQVGSCGHRAIRGVEGRGLLCAARPEGTRWAARPHCAGQRRHGDRDGRGKGAPGSCPGQRRSSAARGERRRPASRPRARPLCRGPRWLGNQESHCRRNGRSRPTSRTSCTRRDPPAPRRG